jgi:hypothetical protein
MWPTAPRPNEAVAVPRSKVRRLPKDDKSSFPSCRIIITGIMANHSETQNCSLHNHNGLQFVGNSLTGESIIISGLSPPFPLSALAFFQRPRLTIPPSSLEE